MEFKLIRGAAADAMLLDNAFLDRWRGLRAGCAWATPFQDVPFIRAWYRAYRTLFEPLLLLCSDSAGQLLGFLPLAVVLRSSAVVPAGDYQAEYPGWISIPSLSDSFPLGAFAAVRREFPRATVTFRYLPPRIPLDWTARAESANLCVLRKWRRPLLCLRDAKRVENSLNKSGNKSRLRQLKKLGRIEFKRVDDPAEFDALLADLARHHDSRFLAVHGYAPFQKDALKLAFTRSLMNETGLLHISALTVGGELVSVHLNVIKQKEVQLGLIAHNAAYEHFSPGKLHLHFLARMLMQTGYEQIDLTPGGEAYKERFANCGDDVHGMVVFPSPARRALGVASMTIENAAKRTMKAMNLSPMRLRSIARRPNRRYAPIRAATAILAAVRSKLHGSANHS